MGIKKAIYSLARGAKDNAPALYLAAGLIGFVGTVVLACYETTKVEGIINEHRKHMSDVNDTLSRCASDDPDYEEAEYTAEDAKKDKFIFTVKTGGEIVKNYAPAIIVGGLSVTAFLASYKILHGRYVAAATLAASLSEAFSKYRERVRNEVGVEKEKDIYYNVGTAHVTTVNEKDDIKEEDFTFRNPGEMPIYAKCFDEVNTDQYNKSHSVNLMFIKGVENRLNDKFHERGYLFLNEVYEALGFNQTIIGNEVGWFESHGDQFVDFGVREIYDSDDIAEYNKGKAPGIWISPNCVPVKKGDLPAF